VVQDNAKIEQEETMRRISGNHRWFTLTAILVCAGLVLCPLGASVTAQGEYSKHPADERSAEAMLFDAAFVRLLGIVGMVVGTAGFIISLPFSASGGNTNEAYERLMADPARYTFKRPLGDF
jgi:hypothetical protein